jgi:phosphoadenosine phosphosulfate reductase
MKALWFSGGRDSLACLYLHRAELDAIHVLFVNTGRSYPEQLAVAERARAMCQKWVEILTDRVAQWAANGLPADVVPVDWTVVGQKLSRRKPVTIQSYVQCCHENIAGPLMAKTKELGCTEVICGQRADEPHRGSRKHGDVVDGVRFLHPIEDWTAQQVLEFLEQQHGPLPEHFALEHSSMDCFDCTAYAAHAADRIAYMKQRHPGLYEEYMGLAEKLEMTIAEALQPYVRLREARMR